MWVICLDNVRNHCLNKKIKKDALLYVIRLPKDCTRFPSIRKCKYFHYIIIILYYRKRSIRRYYCSPHPHVKHYHIKQNTRGEFYLSEKHCCGSIPDLVNYHRHNSGGLASRLKTSPCDRPVPPTAGLSHGL